MACVSQLALPKLPQTAACHAGVLLGRRWKTAIGHLFRNCSSYYSSTAGKAINDGFPSGTPWQKNTDDGQGTLQIPKKVNPSLKRPKFGLLPAP